MQREWLKLQTDKDADIMLDPPDADALVPAAAMQAAAAAGCLRRQKAAQWKAAPPRPRAQQPSCWTTQHPRRRGPGRRRGSCSGRRPSRRALGRTCQAQARRRCMGTLPCAGDSIFVRLNLFWQTNQQRMKQPSSVSMAQDSSTNSLRVRNTL